MVVLLPMRVDKRTIGPEHNADTKKTQTMKHWKKRKRVLTIEDAKLEEEEEEDCIVDFTKSVRC